MFDEEIGTPSSNKVTSTPKVKANMNFNSNHNADLSSDSDSADDSADDDYDDDEIDDQYIQKLVIITQTPPANRKHASNDRTGDYYPRSKITADLAKEINDGLFYYEQKLLKNSTTEKCR